MQIRITKKIVDDEIERLDKNTVFEGVKTGFVSLDYHTGGFANGDVIIMGARPSMGRTAFACSLIENVCISGGKSCLFYTNDMPAGNVMRRLIQQHGNIKAFEESEGWIAKAQNTADIIGAAKLYIGHTYDSEDFFTECRQVTKKERIDIVVIDCLHSIEQVGEECRNTLWGLKRLAVELDCPVFILSQINRSAEKRKKHFPQIADLPNYKIIDEVADEILFLYRPAYYNRKYDKNLANIEIAKHKACRRVATSLFFDPDIPMFRSNVLISE